jgi:flagellar motor switch protein FliN/FliY
MSETAKSDADPGMAADMAANYTPAALKPLQPEPRAGVEGEVNLDVILDIPVAVSVEIGRAQIAVGDVLRYSQGSVVELDRLVGEPLDVLVNGTLIAHGEVVVLDDRFGVRLTDVISAAERLKKLR